MGELHTRPRKRSGGGEVCGCRCRHRAAGSGRGDGNTRFSLSPNTHDTALFAALQVQPVYHNNPKENKKLGSGRKKGKEKDGRS
uniref:Uncharacterized protein n=1 Tax=Oryza punctata TaxID=4537 RepID=A0A0E0L4X6_ORYPU